MGAIYRIWNVQNGKSYIGQSYRPYRRIQQHLTPGSATGSPAIQKDLLNYPPDSWQWEILDNTDRPYLFDTTTGRHHYFKIDDLERRYIREYDSVHNGYNIMPGGQGRSGTDRLTADESWRSSHMQREIYDAIDDYQFRHQHGISREVYQRQQQQQRQREIEYEIEQQRQRDAVYLQRFGVTYDRYERIIAEHGSWEAYQEHKDNRTGCWVISIAFLIFLIIVRAC